MIELRGDDQIDEEYIIELHEYRMEWVKLMNAMVNNELSKDELTNVILLTDFYCKTFPPLNHCDVQNDFGGAVKAVLEFLNGIIKSSEETYGELSEGGKIKIHFFTETVFYIQQRMVAMNSIEKALG